MLSEEQIRWLKKWADAKGSPAFSMPVTPFLASCILALHDSEKDRSERFKAFLREATRSVNSFVTAPGFAGVDKTSRVQCPHGWSREHVPGSEHEWVHWAAVEGHDENRAFRDGEFLPCGCLATKEGAIPREVAGDTANAG